MKFEGGDGVLMGADDGAEVPDDAEGTRKCAGDWKLAREPRERSCAVPDDWLDESARPFNAADIMVRDSRVV